MVECTDLTPYCVVHAPKAVAEEVVEPGGC